MFVGLRELTILNDGLRYSLVLRIMSYLLLMTYSFYKYLEREGVYVIDTAVKTKIFGFKR